MTDMLYDPTVGHYYGSKDLPDGRRVWAVPMIFNTRLLVGDPDSNYVDDAYCYRLPEQALDAMSAWDGTGDPDGWIKHVGTGRFRPDGDPTKEFVQ